MKPKSFVGIAIAAILIFSVSNCTFHANAQTINREDMLVSTSTSTVLITGNFNPLLPGYQYGYAWFNLGITEPLYIYDDLTNGLIPWLADGQPTWLDNYTLQVNLKTGVFWQDGVPFNSSDVVYTYKLATRGIVSATYQYIDQLWIDQGLQDIQAINASVVDFIFNSTNPYPERLLLREEFGSSVGCILPEHIFEPAEQQMKQQNKTLIDFVWNQPVGTGPYKLNSYTDQRVITERWDQWWGQNYFGKLPEPKYLVFVSSPSNDVATRELTSSDADWSAIAIPQIGQLEELYGLVTWQTSPPYFAPPLASVDAYGFNLPQMEQRFGNSSSAIRQAIGFAIDRNQTNNAAYFQAGTPLYDVSLIPPDSTLAFLRNETLLQANTFSYSVTKAEQILDAAGIKDYDGDGIRELPDRTTKVTLTGYSVEGFSDWTALLQLFQSYCSAIGIHVDANYVPTQVFFGTLASGKGYDVYTVTRSFVDVGGYHSILAPFDSTAMSIPLMFMGKSGNAMGYVNSTITSIRQQLATYYDPTDPTVAVNIEGLASLAQQILAQDLPAIPVGGMRGLTISSPKYWTGWATQDNPYPSTPTSTNQALLTYLHVHSTTAATNITQAQLPEGLNATIVSIFNIVNALNASLIGLQNAINNLKPIDYTLQYLNTGLIAILIVVVAYLVITRPKKEED